ncbi:ThiF family adenylyltransferase [Lacinutrix salivirga]
MDREAIANYIERTDHIKLISHNELFFADDFYEFYCTIDINGIATLFRVLCNSNFPNTLPKFYLKNPNQFGFIPHIEPDGSVCYIEKESIYINEDQPDIVFDASVQMVRGTIEAGLRGSNDEDFREEFQAYWERNKNLGKLQVISVIEIGDTPKVIKIVKDSKYAIAADTNRSEQQLINLFLNKKQLLSKTGLFIPLSRETKIVPPNYDSKWSTEELVVWLKRNTTASSWQAIQNSLLTTRPERFEYIIFSIPRNKGADLLAAIKFKPKKDTSNPLLEKEYEWGVVPLSVKRVDTRSILPRGGASMSLQNKKILLVGCGSVGSQIAITLGKLGVGKIDLVDFDTFRLENLNRYALGLKHLGKQKALALKDYLVSNFLSIKSEAYQGKIADFIKKQKISISEYDLVISATGDPNVNFYLTKLTNSFNKPLIIGWNEPYGIGGHAIISLGMTDGCYKCLYRNTYNVASFTAEEQPKPFHKHHLGCGEVFTPYSFYDSIQTSQLVIKLTKDFLSDKLEKSTILSWKGESDEFTEEGFHLSNRYKQQSNDKIFEKRTEFINQKCTYCQ